MSGKNIISAALLGLIALYGITSSGNIIRLVETVHHGWVAWTLGGSLGFTLVVASFIAATAKTRRLFWRAMTVATISGLMSAVFQTYMYIQDGAEWYIAGLLGFGIPLVGEVGVAMLDAEYVNEHIGIEDEAKSSQLARQLSAMHQQLTELRMSADEYTKKLAVANGELETTRQQLATANGKLAALRTKSGGNKRKSGGGGSGGGNRAAQRLQKVVDVVKNHKVASSADLAELTNWTETTSRRYFNMAAEENLIYKNGDGCYHAAPAPG